MALLDTQSLTVLVAIIRVLEVIFTCISLSLVASIGAIVQSQWIWCMFVWCVACLGTLIFLIVEFTGLSAKVEYWDMLSKGFPFLISFKLLTISIIYPVFYVSSSANQKGIGASITSWLACILYATEVFLTRPKPGDPDYFTLSDLLMSVESTVSCMIFINLEPDQYNRSPWLQWCVTVYAICFAMPIIVYVYVFERKNPSFPVEKIQMGSRLLMVMMYLTAVVIWPLYSFNDNPKPSVCKHCFWDKLMVVAVMTGLNLVVYIVDMACSLRPGSNPNPNPNPSPASEQNLGQN